MPEGLVQRLAVESHAGAAGPKLDLRTSFDELGFVRPDIAVLWREWIASLGGLSAAIEKASDYGLADPYGELRAGGALAAHHGFVPERGTVTFGPGVSGLLSQLARLVAGGLLLIERFGHPDLAHWARAAGATIETFELRECADGRLRERIDLRRPKLVAIDRPSIRGELLSAEHLQVLADAASSSGSLILIDEAYANYLGPAHSLAPFAAELPNLVVLRSVSKAYRMGGLRVGYAVASSNVGEAVRRRITPLGASTLPLLFALELLRQGDMFAELRAATAVAKRETSGLLEGSGFCVTAGHPALPWVLIERGGRDANEFGRLGIACRTIPEGCGGDSGVVRMAVPLSPDRRLALRERLK